MKECGLTIRDRLIPKLLHDSRFVSSEACVDRFEKSAELWREDGNFRPVIEAANELAAAAALLDRLEPDDQLRYEPPLKATKKTIDFMITRANGDICWIDMKTVAPTWQDNDAAWERHCELAETFPATAKLIVDQQLGGAGIGGQFRKARWSFVQRTIELEEKIALLTEQERGPVRLLLCDEGTWHRGHLEDFADFYHTGKFRIDDWARNEIPRYMNDKKITFSHSITGFCYLKRHWWEAEAQCLIIDARGPAS